MSEGSRETPVTTTHLDGAPLPGGDIVSISAPSAHFRSSEHGSSLAGCSLSLSQDEEMPDSESSKASALVSGPSQIDLSMSEDLEITPHFGTHRADTLPEWMLSNPAPVVRSEEVPAYLAESKPASRGVWVALLGVVAAGTWWFAADGVNLMNDTASSSSPVVVAAAPAISVSPKAPVLAPVPTPEPTLSPAPAPEPETSAKGAQKPVAEPAPRARKVLKKRNKPRAKFQKPAAPAKQVGVSKVTGLTLGEAGSGRSCRALGSTVSASDHERVNLCFKIQPAAGVSSVVVQWRHNGSIVRSTEHDLPSDGKARSIRAFSRVQSAQSGKWTVQVRTQAGKVLASKNFSVSM